MKRRAARQPVNDTDISAVKQSSTYLETVSSCSDGNESGRLNCVEHYSYAIDKENLPQLPTPKTPRHRDAFSKKVQITPRHEHPRGKPLTPHAPWTPRTPSNASSIFACARKLFVTGAGPGKLIGRADEKRELGDIVGHGLTSGKSQCVYVSGPPGTGKSAVVSELCSQLRVESSATFVYVNCMSLQNSDELCRKLINELSGDPFRGTVPTELAAELQSMLSKPKKAKNDDRTYTIILDEVDSLLQLDVEIVYKLFEWSLLKSSRFILIGIANALDLTDRFLPSLKARNLKPRLLPFMPYTADQIVAIVTEKLQSLLSDHLDCPVGFIPFIHPVAIQLCARKVASQTGDLRKAFNIIRRTIEVVEAETIAKHNNDLFGSSPSKSPLGENPNLASKSLQQSKAPQKPLDALTPLTAPRGTVAHVSRVAAAVLSHGTTQRLQGLNLQQKAALCALDQHEARQRKATSSLFATPLKSKRSGPTVRTLYSSYSASCQQEHSLTALTLSEFVDVISSLESLGLVYRDCGKATGARSTPSKRAKEENMALSSLVDPKEMRECLRGAEGVILRSLIQGV